MKVYYDNFKCGGGDYKCPTRWYDPDFKVLDMTEEEALEFADKMYEQGVEVFVIDYKAEKGIGALARHINQCYGMSEWSYYRSLELRNEMRAIIKRNNFRAIFPVMREAK